MNLLLLISPQTCFFLSGRRNLVFDVAESWVYGMRHPRMGETVHARVVLKENVEMVPEELISYTQERLLPFKYPQRIFFVDQIDKTSSGKAYRRGT